MFADDRGWGPKSGTRLVGVAPWYMGFGRVRRSKLGLHKKERKKLETAVTRIASSTLYHHPS